MYCHMLMPPACVGMLSSTRSGLCEYFEKQEYYHVAAVFGLGRVELYVGMYMLQGSKNLHVESGGAKFDCADTHLCVR